MSLYLAWGCRGGIDSADVVYVAEHADRVIGLVRHCIDHGVTVLLERMRVYQQQGRGVVIMHRAPT